MDDMTKRANQFVHDPGLPAPIKLAHISIGSNENYEQMCDFYRDLLNMRVVYEIKGLIRFCMLSFDDEHHRVGIAKLPHLTKAEPGRIGLEHSSWTYRSFEELFTVVKRYHAKTGQFPFRTVHQGPIVAVSYRDPDGNRVELICDVCESQEAIIQFMQDRFGDPTFNTLLPFDLAKMIELYDNGMPVEELTQYDMVLRLLAEGKL
jgi:catechol 2,3-dioxygenase-like lactoylglutathione lyase family enzyme